MRKSGGSILVIVLGAMVAGMVFLSMSGLVFYNLAVRGIRGSRDMATEQRSVDGFDEVSICCGMQLLLDQGGSHKVVLEGDDNLMKRVRTSVEGDRLVVDYEPGLRTIRPSRPIRVHVTMPEVRGVDTSGGSRMTASEIDTDHFDLSVSGGGHAEIEELNAEEFALDLSGGGKVAIDRGEVENQRLRLSGGSGFTGADLESESTELDVSGGGDVTLWVEEELDVTASGGSQIHLYGQPRITQDSSGGSRIQSMGDR